MHIQQGIGEKNGRLCFVEIEMDTGKYHYYPIMAKVNIFMSMSPNSSMVIPDAYIYVDRKNEI